MTLILAGWEILSRVSARIHQRAPAPFSSGDPLADVWIAVCESDTGRFAPGKKIDAISTRQGHVFEIEVNAATFSFRADECFQFANVLLVDLSAQGEDHVPVRYPSNS
jgi:hypothetical protein